MQSKEVSMEFIVSILFHHIKLDASCLNFSLIDDLIPSVKYPVLNFENNISEKCFKLENYDFCHLLLKLKPSYLVEIFMCVLHERKIVLVNNDQTLNAAIMQTLLTILFPLSPLILNIVSILTP